MRRPFFLLSVFALVAACSGGGSSSDQGGAGGSAASIPALNPAAGLAITQVDLYQGIQVPLMLDAAEVPHVAPVVRGREGMFRVHVAPIDGYQPREVVVRVQILGGAAPVTIDQKQLISAPSTAGDLGSTANVPVPGDAIVDGATYSVAVLEAATGVTNDGDTSRTRWPASGEQALAPEATNAAQKIVVIPIQYMGDGSGRLPDTGPDAIERLRAHMFALYPTPSVEITVGAPLVFNTKLVATSGAAWQSLTNAVIKRRGADNPGNDVYYYGLVKPAASFGAFCGGGCIAGLTITPGSGAQPAELRVSTGLGFVDDASSGTFVHEIGHAHGLKHAPCSQFGGIQDVDSKFPHKGAQLGVYGYDAVTSQLKPPTKWVDMMSYCEPTWISDYNYAKLSKELQRVAGGARVVPPSSMPKRWRLVSVDASGDATVGESIPARDVQSGDQVTVTLLDASGAAVRTVTGFSYGFDHAEGSLVLVPDGDDIHGARVALPIIRRSAD